MKIRPVGDELFHAVRQTHMTKPIAAFRNAVNAPRNEFRSSDLPIHRY
jgi:hypothetical protein